MNGALVVMADVASTDLSTAFGSALSTCVTQVQGYIGQALPYGLGIMITILGITIGVKAFKRFAH